MKPLQVSEIEYVDVVVIGGGIAGVAIAEFLARHSNLSIKLLEKAPQLGTLASGKLEGWYHTGALYSGQDDAQTFINCVNGLEDLINLYSPYFKEQCNVNLVEKNTNFFSPNICPNSKGWFNDAPVYLIHPQEDAPEIRSSRLKSDAIQINIQRNRVLGRLEVAYGKQHNWLVNDQCLAPTNKQVENYEKLDCSLKDSTEIIRNLCSQFDESYNMAPSNYDFIKTLDCSMHTSRILQDLVGSCLSRGVTFETGIKINKLLIDGYGKLRIKSLLCETQEGRSKRLKAKLFIFAVGEGFEPFLKDLQVRAKLKRSRSAMVVAYPALVDTNFVRMSTKTRFHFNHFVQQRELGHEKYIYSLLADSGYANDDSNDGVAIEPILESAERYFGKEKLYSRQLYSYECVKTEFISQEEQKRRYSYWIESDEDSNYMCVLPGKFSFFPTVAYQAYQRIKTLLDFEETQPKYAFQSNLNIETKANQLVAESYPMHIFLAN